MQNPLSHGRGLIIGHEQHRWAAQCKAAGSPPGTGQSAAYSQARGDCGCSAAAERWLLHILSAQPHCQAGETHKEVSQLMVSIVLQLYLSDWCKQSNAQQPAFIDMLLVGSGASEHRSNSPMSCARFQGDSIEGEFGSAGYRMKRQAISRSPRARRGSLEMRSTSSSNTCCPLLASASCCCWAWLLSAQPSPTGLPGCRSGFHKPE